MDESGEQGQRANAAQHKEWKAQASVGGFRNLWNPWYFFDRMPFNATFDAFL
jgi:hypothetical protein